MSERFVSVWALAEVDYELITLERSRGALPARVGLAQLTETFAGLERARALLEPEHAPLAAQLSSLEAEVAQLNDRRLHVEARLSQATGAGKELEAMHTEARHLAERTAALEEAELELMEALEPLEQRLNGLRAEGRPLLEERARLEAQLLEQEAALEATVAERRAARSSREVAVDADLLELYERGVRRSGESGASRLEHGTCSGCHLSLPAATADRLRHLDPEEISICEQCERILLRPVQLEA